MKKFALIGKYNIDKCVPEESIKFVNFDNLELEIE